MSLLACRHQWFQTQTVVEVGILAKKMTKERVDINIQEQHLSIVIRDAEGEQEFELQLPLYSKVTTRPCRPLSAASCRVLLAGCILSHHTHLRIAMFDQFLGISKCVADSEQFSPNSKLPIHCHGMAQAKL